MMPDLATFAHEASAGGLQAFQLREKDLSTRDLLALAMQIRQAAPTLKLFINDRPDVALACGAAGIHAPEEGWPADRANRTFEGMTVGKSMHSVGAMNDWAGVDFATFGPVFATPSKTALGMGPRGLGALRQASNLSPVPLFAIGGITPERAIQCRTNGAYGVAVMSDLLQAPDLAMRLQEYKSALGEL